MLALVLTVLTGLPAAQPLPQKAELFAKEAWYKGQKGDEKEFVGELQRFKLPEGTATTGRYNEYRLQMDVNGKKEVRAVYVGGKPEVLAAYVGKRVKLVGKAVELEVVGRV